ncbi:MAG: manganese efflux pump MntP family protein [Oscillospiraceae bacterium]|nr:manganese efflux pump MntP family protein [Oscillospiraceae bacterium]
MDIITIMLIALGLSMDAFAVATCQGLRKSNITFALSVALCFGFFQLAMVSVGYFTGELFANLEFVTTFSNWIAFGLLSIIGGRMVYSGIRNKGDCAENDNVKRSLGFWGLIILGIATSIDALAVGVHFGIDKSVDIWIAAGIVGLTTFLISFAGVYFGKLLGKYLAKYAELAGGIILIGIGIKILLS